MIRTVLLILLLIPFACPAQDVTPWTEWPLVEITSVPVAEEFVTTTPAWALDCGLDADQVVGKIVSAAPGPDGSVYLVDGQMVHLLVVDDEGTVTGTIGRHGEGPGDFPGAWRAVHLDDGRVGVSGGGPEFIISYGGTGTIVLLDESGDPAGVWHGAGDPGTMPMSTIRDLRCTGTQVLSVTQRVEFSEGTLALIDELCLLAAPNGDREVIGRHVTTSDVNDMTFHEEDYFEVFGFGRCDLSPDGRVAWAPLRDPWRVVVRNPDGTGFVMVRPWEPVARTDEEKDRIEKLLGGHEECRALDHHPAVGRVRWRPDGRLWVEPEGVEPAAGAFACFDEFDARGELVRRVQLVVPGDPAADELVLMEDGRLALLRGFRNSESDEGVETAAAEVVLLEVEEEKSPMMYDGLDPLLR